MDDILQNSEEAII